MSSLRTALVVGLGGVTNGGKTTMSESLEHLFSSDKYNLRIKSLHLDDYYRPDNDPHHVHLKKYDHHDWDCLDALDIERFMVDLQSLRLKCDILFVEGFLIFNIPSPFKRHHHHHRLFNLAYFFDLPFEECRKRRLRRHDYSPAPDGFFEKHVWHAYIKAKKEAFERNKDVGLELVDTTKESFEKIQEKIVKDIETALKRVQKFV